MSSSSILDLLRHSIRGKLMKAIGSMTRRFDNACSPMRSPNIMLEMKHLAATKGSIKEAFHEE